MTEIYIVYSYSRHDHDDDDENLKAFRLLDDAKKFLRDMCEEQKPNILYEIDKVEFIE